MTHAREWADDGALAGYECTTLSLPPEDDGPLCATLVRRKRDRSPQARRAVLYVHGFVDYFFQAHVADAFAARGWDFYALDLRRYGRSMRDGNRPNYCRDLSEYDLELSVAIDIIRDEEQHDTLVLLGHSTGGLITSRYLHRGARRARVQALVLNSPFLEFNVPASARTKLAIGAALGALLPKIADNTGLPRWYGESLLATFHGEWSYDLKWKPLLGFPVYLGWVRAIRAAQNEVATGLSIACPVLLLHAGASMFATDRWQDEYLSHDIVLNVAHMQARGPRLGANVTLRACAGGIHDLYLSRSPVREQTLQVTFDWLDTQLRTTPLSAPRVADA